MSGIVVAHPDGTPIRKPIPAPPGMDDAGEPESLVPAAWNYTRQVVADTRAATNGRCTPKGATPAHNPYRRHVRSARAKS